MEQASEVGTLRQPLDRVKERYNEIFSVGRHLAEGACIARRDPQQLFETEAGKAEYKKVLGYLDRQRDCVMTPLRTRSATL